MGLSAVAVAAAAGGEGGKRFEDLRLCGVE